MPDENVGSLDSPEKAYEQRLLSQHLNHLIETALTARERSVLTLHLEFGPDAPRSFTELAALLNYNDPIAAQKVYDRAITKLRAGLDSGEYGEWEKAKAAIREAGRKREANDGVRFLTQTGWHRAGNRSPSAPSEKHDLPAPPRLRGQRQEYCPHFGSYSGGGQ